ncbi:hypothetical protein CASFOL_018422 [Castilleja foliolosa]|uniref:Uncharacterized protein n=1 Tax=Castilleja foliolosa TaxID=1961234 RepID=A0ABD3D9Z8_9LAMI
MLAGTKECVCGYRLKPDEEEEHYTRCDEYRCGHVRGKTSDERKHDVLVETKKAQKVSQKLKDLGY